MESTIQFHELIEQFNVSELFDTMVANDLYESVPSEVSTFVGLQLMMQENSDSTTVKITAYEPPKGTTPRVRPGTKLPVVEKLGMKDKELEIYKFGEQYVYTEDELQKIIEAVKVGDGNDARVRFVRDLIVRNLEQIKHRDGTRNEKLFWDGCLGAQVTDRYENGEILADETIVATGTRDLGENGANVGGIDRTSNAVWTDVANADIFGDLQYMDDSFRGKGMKNRVAYMNKITFNEITKNESIREEMKHTTSRVLTSAEVSQLANVEIMVYDEGYLDSAGDWTTFIPDGYVIMIGTPVSATGRTAVVLTSAPNIDATASGAMVSSVYGDFLDYMDERHPVSKAIFFSSYKFPVFENPEAIAFLKVF